MIRAVEESLEGTPGLAAVVRRETEDEERGDSDAYATI
jgi:hypothetical protein